MRTLGLTLVAAVLALCGCAKHERVASKPTSTGPTSAAVIESDAAVAAAHGNGGGDGQANGRGTGKGRGERRGECPVLIDGQVVAVLRYRELPPSMPTTMFALDDGRKVERFTVANYLRALGVPIDRVTALHLHGGNRVSVIDRGELARVGERLQIHFTAETSGRPTFKYPGVDLRANTAIDAIQALAIYLDAPAPEYRAGKFYRAGELVDHGLGAAKLAIRGTRVYLDGKLVRVLRRRDVEGKSLPSLLAKLGVDASAIRELELVSGDTITARIGRARLSGIAVQAPRGGHGRVSLDGAGDGEELEAILLYAKTNPSHRHDREAALGAATIRPSSHRRSPVTALDLSEET